MTKEEVIAGALFDFMGWLTSRKERIVLSSADEASPAADAVRDFAKMRGLSLDNAQVQTWQEALAQPEQEPVAKVVSTAPDRIWLDLGFDTSDEDEVSFHELIDVTWSHDNASGYGVEYVRVDTTQPQRKWVGLTGPEVDDAYRSVSDKEWAIGGLADARVFLCAIETKLKEKNT